MATFTRAVMSIAAAAVLGGATQAQAASGAEYFKGKTVTWIVATAPGGGHDFYARLASRHMERQLPGSTFTVKNSPGAGHILGTNLIYTAKPNGLTIGSFSTGITYSQIVGKKGIRFDLAKMSWIGKGATDTRVVFVSKLSNYKTFQDLVNSKTPVKLGTSGVGTGAFNESYMLANAFKLPFRTLVGYSGSERSMGMLRGEIDGAIGGYSSLLEVAGLVGGNIVLQFGTEVPNVPNGRDFAKTEMQKKTVTFIEGQGQLYRLSAGPPNIPADRLAALRKAFLDAYNSKELRAEAKRANRPVDPLGGEEVARLIKDLVDQPKEMVDLLIRITSIKAVLLKHTGKVTQVKRGGRQVAIDYEGKEVETKISGSRTQVLINGKKAKRKAIKVGMTCTFHYAKPGAESKTVDCRG